MIGIFCLGSLIYRKLFKMATIWCCMVYALFQHMCREDARLNQVVANVLPHKIFKFWNPKVVFIMLVIHSTTARIISSADSLRVQLIKTCGSDQCKDGLLQIVLHLMMLMSVTSCVYWVMMRESQGHLSWAGFRSELTLIFTGAHTCLCTSRTQHELMAAHRECYGVRTVSARRGKTPHPSTESAYITGCVTCLVISSDLLDLIKFYLC